MRIPATLAADLALLTEVLDSSAPDVADTLSELVFEVARAVPSYIGLSLLAGDRETAVEVTTIENATQAARIHTSLRFSLASGSPQGGHGSAAGVLILYAAGPGALVDLAADLTWLTGQSLIEAHLDEDLAGPKAPLGRPLQWLSTINQALGLLIDGGLTLEQANAEIDARSAATGLARHLAAGGLLASPPPRKVDHTPPEEPS